MMDINILNKYKADGLLMSQVHPELPLIIWNYTDKCQYEAAWDEITLNCRGLVTDTDGNQINHPIPKFFNYSETLGKYVCNFKKSFKVFTKYDGSLIQMFYYQDSLVITSRGSFASDQVGMVREIGIPYIEKGKTFVFELIHPENRIVVDYGDKKELVLLAVRDENGDHCIEQYTSKFKIAEQHELNIKKYKDLKHLSTLNLQNEEGYVFLFANGKRCKVKFDEYRRLHSLVTELSNTAIWKVLKSGEDVSGLIEGLPDEFHELIKSEIQIQKDLFENRKYEILLQYNEILKELPIWVEGKEFAYHIKTHKYKSHFFNLSWGMEDKVDAMVWDEIKPKFKKIML